MKTNKIKLNAQKRKLSVEVFKSHYQKEDNILKTAYYEKRKLFDTHIQNAFETVKKVIERKNPTEDVAILKPLQHKHNFDVVRKDSCFHLKSDQGVETTRYDGQKEIKYNESYVNFNLNGGNSHYSDNVGIDFALAYNHDYLKQKNLVPECLVMQGDKQDNPYHTDLKDKCLEELGLSKYSSYHSDSLSGMGKEWQNKYTLEVIGGSSHCNSRFYQCTQDELDIVNDFRIAKEQLIIAHKEWQGNIVARVKIVDDTLKNYTTYEQVKNLADKQGIEFNENYLNVESRELAIFNPENVSSMLDDLKPKAKETRKEKIARVMAYQSGAKANG